MSSWGEACCLSRQAWLQDKTGGGLELGVGGQGEHNRQRLCEWKEKLWAVIGYRDTNFGISTGAMRARCTFHACSVCRVIGHNFALPSIVGIIPPMKPTIVGARSDRGEKCGLGRPLRVIRHTVLTTVARGSLHTGQEGCQLLNFCIPGVGARGVGSEDDGSVGAPALLASVGVLGGLARRALSLILLLSLPGITFSSTGLGLVGGSFGCAREGRSWVGLGQVVTHFFEKWKKCVLWSYYAPLRGNPTL
jgi:hypothetical protein